MRPESNGQQAKCSVDEPQASWCRRWSIHYKLLYHTRSSSCGPRTLPKLEATT